MTHPRSTFRLSTLLAFLCATTLVLVGCASGREVSPAVAQSPTPLARSMKGYELYSWPIEGENEWYHVLMTGTDRLKTYEQILATGNAVTGSNWVRLAVRGREELKTALRRLPKGESVTWITDGWLERMGAPLANIQLPDPEVIEEIDSYCRHLGIHLQVAD